MRPFNTVLSGALFGFSLLCFHFLCPSGAAGADGPLPLVKEGRSAYTIVYAKAAPSSVRKAAWELQHYIEKSTSAKLPIVETEANLQEPHIALGNGLDGGGADIDNDLASEGFHITTRDGNLYISGPDTGDGQMTKEGGTSTGTLNGVYTFIEDYLDVRWLLPGPMGEDVPRVSEVVVPHLDRREMPGFRNRRVPGIQNKEDSVKIWEARQKLGFSLKLEHSHNWQYVVPASLHEQHPDWFPEMNGKRPPVSGDRYKIETTNPALVQHYADAAITAFKRDPNKTVFSLSPTDSDGWSTSAESQALFDRDPRGKLSVTPLVLKFYNDVAKIVGKEFPDKKLAGYIYASYLFPPSKGIPDLEPNLLLVVAPSISYGYQLYRSGVREEWEKLLQDWSAKTSQIAYYDLFNWLRGSSGAITPPAPGILNFAFPRLAKYGIKGVYVYGTEEWSQAGVNNYVLAKMAWNPSLDANALCDEFYRRAYGEEAGRHIREIHQLADVAVKRFYNDDPSANYTATPRYQSDVLAANYGQIEKHYLAAREASDKATDAQKARLDFFGDNLILMQWKLRASGFISEMKSSPLFRTDKDVEAMTGRMHTGFGVYFAPRMKPMEKTFAPVRIERNPRLAHGLPVKPMGLRGKNLFLCVTDADEDITIEALKIAKAGTLMRYDAFAASGNRVAGGVLKVGSPAQFFASAGQIYYVEVHCDSPYEVAVTGSDCALAANTDDRGLHLSSKPTSLWFYVPKELKQFTLSISTGAPGETSLSELYSPNGSLVKTFDTQSAPVSRETIHASDNTGPMDGFWRLSVGKAPKGGFDDVFISLDENLPQWFSLDPDVPLTISPLPSLK